MTGIHVTDALTTPLAHEPVPSDQVIAGRPVTGSTGLHTVFGVEVGVWEHTAGVTLDSEVDEVFVVVAPPRGRLPAPRRNAHSMDRERHPPEGLHDRRMTDPGSAPVASAA